MSKHRRKKRHAASEAAPSLVLAPTISRPKRIALAALCAVVAILVFAPTLNFEFVDWDDPGVLTENPNWRGLGAEQLSWMFRTNHFGHYQPITWITYGVDYLIWGLNPRGYHLTNVLFHGANTLLVWFLASILLRAALLSIAQARPWLIPLGASFVALVFGLHPLRVESVAWATERRDLVSAFFILLTVLLYLRSTMSVGGRQFGWFSASLVVYIISMLSKVGGAPLPLILLVLDWYPLQRLDRHPSRWLYWRSFGVLLEKLPFLLVSLIFSLATIQQQTGKWLIPLEIHSLPARIAQAFYGLVFYVQKTVLPLGLSPLYELKFPLNPLEPRFVVCAILVVLAAAVIAWRWRRWPGLLAAAAVYAVMIGPLLGFFQNGPQIVADRYSYLSTLSWVILLVGGTLMLLHRRHSNGLRVIAAALAVLIVAGLSVLTIRQSMVWQNTATLWRAVYEHDPESSFGNNSYGYVLMERGELERAEVMFRKALEVRLPSMGNREAQYNLIDVLQRKGMSEIEAYGEAYRANPHESSVAFEYGTKLLLARRNTEAAEVLEQAVENSPGDARARTNYGVVLNRLDRLEDALQHLDIARQLDPTLWNAWDNLAIVLIRLGRQDQARQVLEMLLRRNPGYEPARRRLESLNAG